MTRLIVEVCQNHNGDRAVLRDMIQAAAAAGADIVKGQIIFSKDLTRRERFEEGIVEGNGVRKAIKRPYEIERERLAKLDLAEDDYGFFVAECNRAGVEPMLTIFARRHIPLARSLPWRQSLIKVASYDCGSFALLKELARDFDRLIVSTGATFDDEIAAASNILRQSGKPYAMLHCVTSYPNTLAICNLARIAWLRQFAPAVGWSDHTLTSRDGIKAAEVAIMLGADYVERHFTILPAEATKDGPVSLNPELLAKLAAFNRLPVEEQHKRVETEIPEWRTLLGRADREMTYTEILNRDYYRGRFASFASGEWVYNWEEKPVLEA